MAAKVHRLQSQTAQALGPKNWGRTLLRSHLLCCQSRPKTGSGNPDREPAALLNNHGDAGVKVNKSTPAGTGHRRRWRVDRPPSPCGWGWGGERAKPFTFRSHLRIFGPGAKVDAGLVLAFRLGLSCVALVRCRTRYPSVAVTIELEFVKTQPCPLRAQYARAHLQVCTRLLHIARHHVPVLWLLWFGAGPRFKVINTWSWRKDANETSGPFGINLGFGAAFFPAIVFFCWLMREPAFLRDILQRPEVEAPKQIRRRHQGVQAEPHGVNSLIIVIPSPV